MPTHIIMAMMILSGVSSFTFAQETPATNEQNAEQVAAPETKENADTAPQQEAQKSAAQDAETTATPAPKESAEEPKETTETETPSETEAPSEETAAPEQTEAEAPADETAEQPKATEDATPEEGEAEETAETAAEDEMELIQIPAPMELIQIPAPIEEQEVIIPDEIVEEEPVGIDTVSLENPQGNWLFKRIWWDRAQDRYEKIRQLVDAVWEFRTRFFIARSSLDRNVLDPFYITIGIDQGELEAIIAEINDRLETQSARQEDMTDEERRIYEDYAPQEEALKQLRNDVESIGKFDRAIDDALVTLMNQINRVRQYETDAWGNFKEIAKILNDTKARELYYTIEGAAKNIKSISNYLEQEFFTHFNKLVDDATLVVSRVQKQMDALKEKGIRFERQTEISEQQRQQVTQDEDEDEDEDDEDVQPKPKLGWFAWIGSLFSNTFSYIFSIIRMPYDMIFGK